MTSKRTFAAIALSILMTGGAFSPALSAERTEQQWTAEVKKTEKAVGPNDQRLGEMLFANGNYYHKKKQYEKEAPLYARAMSIFEKSPGKNGDMLRFYSDSLARVYFEEGRYDEAERLFNRALKLADQMPGKDKTFVVPHTLHGLAQVKLAQNKYSEAESLLKQRIEMRHRFMNHGQVDVALIDLANLYTNWGKLDESKQLFDQLMTIQPRPAEVRAGWQKYQAKVGSKGESGTAN
jgi:tetratricopeptide (TPR) repeat protein